MDEYRHNKSFFRERKIGRICLYIELFYVTLLAYSLIFAFSLFAHLILGQFIIIVLYFASGWCYGLYLKATGKLPEGGPEKRSFKEKNMDFWSRFDRKFFYNSLELVTVLLGIYVFSWSFAYIYVEFFGSVKSLDPVQSLIGYLNFALIVVVFFNVAGLLMGRRYLVRKCAIAEIAVAVVLLWIYPLHWITLLLAILTAVSLLFLFAKNKI